MRFRTNDKGFITLRFADFPNTDFELDEGYGDGSMTIDLIEPEEPDGPQTSEQREAERKIDAFIAELARDQARKRAAQPRFAAAHLPPSSKDQ